jgi:hypothetical protein
MAFQDWRDPLLEESSSTGDGGLQTLYASGRGARVGRSTFHTGAGQGDIAREQTLVG